MSRGKKENMRRQVNRRDQQGDLARTLDQLAEFEKFNDSILPQIRKCIMDNWTPERIRKHFAPIIQGKMVERAITGDFKAMKDVLDRHEGMAVQRVESKTVYQQMGGQELAALALQKFKDAGMIDADYKVIVDPENEDN